MNLGNLYWIKVEKGLESCMHGDLTDTNGPEDVMLCRKA